ncbi:uncharacterized protein LOC106074351 isoform X3 [Biomphalaria glabrata]|uniref:chitin synthase n=1 Tax=Biomphalaria glabrata TaxID=6526 RepID=A0A9W2YD07_BIOGL|nr:uncharacterized protein LOC106074351 isoform X3 [Biomphalaria glabrata]
MPKSVKKETPDHILNKVQEDETAEVQRQTNNWLQKSVADNVNKSLQSLHSSDSSDKSSLRSEDENTYWDIDALTDKSILTDSLLSMSSAMSKNNFDYATAKKKNKSGVDNLAFQNTEDIPESKPFMEHDTTRSRPTPTRLESVAPDYDSNEDVLSPSPDYGDAVRPAASFSFNVDSPRLNKKLPGSAPAVAKKPESIPLDLLSKPRTTSVHFRASPVFEEQSETYSSTRDPLKLMDLSKLPELNLDSITDSIKKRYFNDKIYTYCGEILISVNPYKPLEMCTSQFHYEYRYGQISEEPHLFAISAKAYSAIRDLKHNQVILVSGESGAGKTEATKYIVQHLMSIGGSEYDNLQDKIIRINPLLEAFGNAKTILNSNSSRFAKFLSLAVNEQGKIESARVKDYMLEKSRVVHHSPKERTFHAFYALLVGASEDLLDSLYIKRKDKFRITGGYYDLNVKEREAYKIIYEDQQDVFHLINLTPEEIQDVNSILAAILHLGNIEFEDSDNDSVIIKNESVVQQAAFLLHLDVEKLTRVLIERRGRLGKDSISLRGIYLSQRDFGSSSQRSSDDDSDSGEIIELSKNKKQADDERDAIAKVLYERMFGWLVRKVNDSLKANKLRNLPSIGILDICGFENLETNSFEQLCINIVNEQLQNFMNKKVIEEERQLYLDEHVEISDIDISGINNDAILNMFMERNGILAMIDEDSRIDFSDDNKLVTKLKKMFDKDPHFEPSANNTPEFGIVHFAGKVYYSAVSFIQKNRDTLSDDTLECLKSSENTLIQDLFTVQESHTGSISMSQFNFRGSRKPNSKQRHVITDTNLSQSINQSRKTTLDQRFGDRPPGIRSLDMAKRNTHVKFFKHSLQDLIDAMKQADPYFVRCIKPNDKQKPKEFIDEQVRVQLQYNGVKEAARIRTFGFGYPVRMPVTDFEQKFKDLVTNPTKDQLADDILETVLAEASTFKIGKTQIFMKENVKKALEDSLHLLRRQQEMERLKKLEMERLEKERQEQLQKMEKERLLKEHRDKMAKEFMRFSQDDVDGRHLDTITEVQTPASNVSDGDYNMSKHSSSSRDTQEDEDEDSDDSSDQTFEKIPVESENKSDKKPWDISQELTEEEEKNDVHEQPVLMVLKFIVYILLLVLIFAALTCQKISLMIAIKNMTVDKKDKDARQKFSKLYLVFAMCIPNILWWIITVLKLCFGNYKSPSVWTWIWVTLMESLHSVGLSLLVFRVLKYVDPIRGLMLLSGVAIIPSILKFSMSEGDFQASRNTCVECESSSPQRKAVRILFDFVAMGFQLTVIPLSIFLDFLFTDSINNHPSRVIEIVFALLLVSCGHWENFVDGRFFCELKNRNWFKNAVLKMRFELQKGRHFPHLVSLLFKIGLTIWLGYQLTELDYVDTFQHMHSKFPILDVSAVITLCISPFVAFYLSFGACMFQMQIPSLTIPLTFATPAAIGVFALNNQYNFLTSVSSIIMVDPPASSPMPLTMSSLITVAKWWHILFGIGWWFSLLILTRYIWRPQKDRTANMERLFLNPSYCGILTTENIMLNRKRHPMKVEEIIKMDDEGEVIGKFYKLKGFKRKKTSDEDFEEDEIGSDVEDSRQASDETMETGISNDSFRGPAQADRSPDVPLLYACATMWHETRQEMIQLLKSLHRLDRDQYIRKLANEKVGGNDPDFYNFEAHIFFDDAMELDDFDRRVPNRWVKDLVKSMDVACSSVHGKPIKVHPPMKIPTPYGGQLIWQMPGENLLFVHMKDVSKIRNRKRWSQVMYMYYLLGYRHIMSCKKDLLEKMKNIDAGRGGFGLNIHEINYLLGEQAAARSHNTFLLALDGDTDFTPGAVKILLDRMKDDNVGAACGRIHPIGNGPMIWYQKFEYAIGHWLQKAAEHVFGCVLCSPGCFSLFRAGALMDTNVMKKYTTEPTEPSHHLQYDQGEDRWLCTLLLQQGYRIEYAAAADAWTFAPEGFFEFFNQRRRWMPSTIANILDLLGTATLTTKKNANMSFPYIIYQWLLMLMTILGPGTILMMIAGAAKLVFSMSNVDAYLFATIPAAVFTIACFWLQSKYQLIFAAVLSVMYTFIMIVVFVGSIKTASENSVLHSSVIVMVILVAIFIIAGFCHPQEIWCLIHGVLYLLTIPSGYLLLVIYSICNLNDVSWGTREVPTKAQRLEMEQKKKEKEEQKKNKQRKGFLARIFNRGEEHLKELTTLVKTLMPERSNHLKADLDMSGESGKSVVELLSKIENNLQILIEKSEPGNPTIRRDSDDTELKSVVVAQPTISEAPVSNLAASVRKPTEEEKPPEVIPAKPLHSILKKRKEKERDELRNPFWAEDRGLGGGEVIVANKQELEFWTDFVTKYLLPIRPSPEEKKKIADGLRDLRNSSSFALIITNLLWMALNFMFQEKQVARLTIKYNANGEQKLEESVLGFAFVALLILLLLLQMIGMFIHRMGTLQHLLAITEIKMRKGDKKSSAKDRQDREDVMRHIREVLKIPAAYDDGNETTPPQLADQNNPLGLSVIGASTRGSQGRSHQNILKQELGRTLKTLGPTFDAHRSSGNSNLNRDALHTLNSVRQRLISGTINSKLENLQHGLGKSFRPQLPPRLTKNTPALMQTSNAWGFTADELSRHRLLGIDTNSGPNNFHSYSPMGAMGRSLMQRSRLINEFTSENPRRPNRSINWSNSDVAEHRRPSHSKKKLVNHHGAAESHRL